MFYNHFRNPYTQCASLFFCFTKTGFGFSLVYLPETSTYCKVGEKQIHTQTHRPTQIHTHTKSQKSTKCQGEKK